MGLPGEQGRLGFAQTLQPSMDYAGSSQLNHKENQIPLDQLKRTWCFLLHYVFLFLHD